MSGELATVLDSKSKSSGPGAVGANFSPPTGIDLACDAIFDAAALQYQHLVTLGMKRRLQDIYRCSTMGEAHKE